MAVRAELVVSSAQDTERGRLEGAVRAAQSRGDDAALAEAKGALGLLEAQQGRFEAAQAAFSQSIEASRRAGNGSSLARSLFNAAVLDADVDAVSSGWSRAVGVRAAGAPPAAGREGSRAAAIAMLQEAAGAAEASSNARLAARAHAERARLDPTHAQASLDAARAHLARMASSVERGETALLVGEAALEAHDAGAAGALPIGFDMLQVALGDASAQHDVPLESHARGYLARAYARAGRFEDALALTRQARFLSQSGDISAAAFVWIGQEAALLSATGRTEEALAAYQRAAESIHANRAALAAAPVTPGRSGYRTAAEPIMAAYADLLLRSAEGAAAPQRLAQARQVIEAVKTLQLDQYFQDECVTRLLQQVDVEALLEHAAMIYPVILADRVEVLVSTQQGQLTRSPSAAPRQQIEADVRELHEGLRDPDSDAWRAPAQRLYQALIAPILPALAQHDIDTLVFAPDGVLRNVPIAALHDGEKFLIERFAIANALSLALVDPAPLAAGERRALIAGVSESREGLEPLPGVASELRDIEAVTPGAPLLDARFTEERFADAMRTGRYTIAHLATHASFGRSAAESFVLAHDRRMPLTKLEEIMTSARVRGAPIELLVLSACDTAVGDEQAVLGIAGVAYRAGARAVLASLWEVSDVGASRLMPEFYRALIEKRLSKAQALREAQLAMMRNPDTAHPYFWSAFILVGNWL